MKNLMVRTQAFRGLFAGPAAIVLLAALLIAAPFHAAFAQVAPTLGTAQNFAVLGSSTVTNTGPTIITGNLGVSPGIAATGFLAVDGGLGIVNGTIHLGDPVAALAQSDVTTAYNFAAGMACIPANDLTGQNLGGKTLFPGVYCFSSSAFLTGTLTLDAQNDPNAVFVFQIVSTLITAPNSAVNLINGAQNCSVKIFWQVGSSTTLDTGTAFAGNILAYASVTLNTGATLSGSALARTGAVTMDSNAVAISGCAVPPVTPTLGKAFSPATISAGGVSTLTITLSNPNTSVATLSVQLTDTLPPGVVIANPTNASTTCLGSGGVAATTDGTTVTLQTPSSIPANGSCTVTVNVTAALGGSYFNSLVADALQTSNGSNAAPAVATLTVPQPTTAPTLGKAFSPATINAGEVSTLTITLNGIPASLTAPLIDTLPIGVGIAQTPSASTTCGGTLTANAGGSTVTLTGGSIPANSSCTVTVNVTAAFGGSYFNSLAAGALQTSNGSNALPAVATLTVNLPASGAPKLSKSFSPATINAGGVSTLTITLSNATTSAATLTAPLADYLPSGVVIADTPNASTTCGGTLTANAGASKVILTGGSIPANGSCTVTVNVTVLCPHLGSYLNSLAAGALKTSNGSNAAPAVATLTVLQPPPPINLKCASLTTGTVGVDFMSNLQASGGTPPYHYLISSGTLPGGLVLGNSGMISGTPTAAGTYSFTVQVSDSKNMTASVNCAIRIAPPPPLKLECGTCGIDAAKVGTPYSVSLPATGGVGPYTYSIVSGSLPPGLTLNTSTGQITGTPTTAGTYRFTAKVVDSKGNSDTSPCSIVVVGVPIHLSCGDCDDNTGKVGTNYSEQLVVKGGIFPYTFSIASSSLPPGLTLNTSTGQITGTPTTAGTYRFTAKVVDSKGNSDTSDCSIVVVGVPIHLSCDDCDHNTGKVGTGYSEQLVVRGGIGPYTFSIASGSLPPGLTLNTSTGKITGTPTDAGTYKFKAKVADNWANSDTLDCSIVVVGVPIHLNCGNYGNDTGKVGTPFAKEWVASGGIGSYTFSIASGSLPPGLTLNTSTGKITGTPTAADTYRFMAKVVDSKENSDTSTWFIVVMSK